MTRSVSELSTVSRACHAAAAGFDVCARRAGAPERAEQIRALAREARGEAEAVAALVPSGVPRPSMSDKLRWEWLASTAATIDRSAEGRLFDEALSELQRAASAASRLRKRADRETRAVLRRLDATLASAALLVAHAPQAA